MFSSPKERVLVFLSEDGGATLVEYAVALLVVIIVGGSGAIAVGSNTGVLASAGSDSVELARVSAEAAIN